MPRRPAPFGPGDGAAWARGPVPVPRLRAGGVGGARAHLVLVKCLPVDHVDTAVRSELVGSEMPGCCLGRCGARRVRARGLTCTCGLDEATGARVSARRRGARTSWRAPGSQVLHSRRLERPFKPMGKRGGMTVANLKVERWVSCPFHDEIPALVRHDGDGACNLTLGLEGQIFRERE